MTAARWLLVIPASIAAWYAAFIVGAFTYSFIEAHLCPAEDLISGICANQSIRIVLDVTMHVFVAVSAIAVMIAAVSVAPVHKKRIAWLTFVVGAAAAFSFAVRTHHYTLLVAALLGSLVTLAFFHAKTRSATREPRREVSGTFMGGA